jgi:hypothetical protein
MYSPQVLHRLWTLLVSVRLVRVSGAGVHGEGGHETNNLLGVFGLFATGNEIWVEVGGEVFVEDWSERSAIHGRAGDDGGDLPLRSDMAKAEGR